MPKLRRYRIFISHAWKYSRDYRWLVEHLEPVLKVI